MVLDLEGVAQLDPERTNLVAAELKQPREHRDRVVVDQVVAERLVRHLDVGVAQPGEDAAYVRWAEQGGVELHARVKVPVLDQVPRDRLDLVWRAAVHRRQRDVVGEHLRDLDVVHLGEAAGDDVDAGVALLGAVEQLAQEPAHVRLLDAGEVVADARVEDHARAVALEAEAPVQRMDEHPGADVLVVGLLHPQLLRPLDVVALVLHVDAGLGDLQLVQRLHGLQLDEARTTEPGDDDVLGHLRVGAGGDAEGVVQQLAVLAGLQAAVRRRREERGPWDSEDRAAVVELVEDPGGQVLEGQWVESVGHFKPLGRRRGRAGFARSRPRCRIRRGPGR